MYSCPACGAEDTAGRSTCQCGADLSLLQRLDAMADAWFNRALEALAAGAPGQALEWLAASCAARPTDAVARRALAKAWAQLGRWAEARDALERARDLEPESPELAEIDQALRAVVTTPTLSVPADTAKIPASAPQRRKHARRKKAARASRA